MRFILTDLKHVERNTTENRDMLEADMQIRLAHIKREVEERAMSLCIHGRLYTRSARELSARSVKIKNVAN